VRVLRIEGLGFWSAVKICCITVFGPLMLLNLVMLVWAVFNENTIFRVNNSQVSDAVGFPVMLGLLALIVAVITFLAATIFWLTSSLMPITFRVSRAQTLRAEVERD